MPLTELGREEARRAAGAAYLRLLSDVRSVGDLPHLRDHHVSLTRDRQGMHVLHLPGDHEHQLVTRTQAVGAREGTRCHRIELARAPGEDIDAEQRVLPADLHGVEGAGVVIPAEMTDEALVAVYERSLALYETLGHDFAYPAEPCGVLVIGEDPESRFALMMGNTIPAADLLRPAVGDVALSVVYRLLYVEHPPVESLRRR